MPKGVGYPKKPKTETSAFKTAGTVQSRKRKNQIDAVNTAPRSQRSKVAKGIIRKNQGRRK